MGNKISGITHSGIKRLLLLLTIIVIVQNILWGNTKFYIDMFGRQISLLDGVLTIVAIGIFFLSTLKINAIAPFTKTFGFFSLFLFYICFSTVFIGFEGKGIVQFIQSSIQLVFCFFGYLYAKSYRDSPEAVKENIADILSIILFSIAIGDLIFVSIWGAAIPDELEGAGRYNTSYSTYVMLGYFCYFCLIFFVSLFVEGGPMKRKKMYNAAFVICVILILLTGARTPLGSGLIGLIGISVLSKHRIKIFRILFIFVVIVVLLVMAGVDIRYFSKDSESGTELNVGLTGRDVWYAEVFLHALEQQPFGSGWGGSDQYVYQIREGKIFNTHSQHLQLFHDLGIIGYGLFLIGFIVVLVRLAKYYKKKSETAPKRFFAMVSFGALIGFFISMITDSTWPASQFYGDYVFLCLGISLYYYSVKNDYHPVSLQPHT